MPNWLLPLLCLIVLATFIYLGFWKGLSTKPDRDNRDDRWWGLGGDHFGGPSDGHGGN
jgi:hypothetical protein